MSFYETRERMHNRMMAVLGNGERQEDGARVGNEDDLKFVLNGFDVPLDELYEYLSNVLPLHGSQLTDPLTTMTSVWIDGFVMGLMWKPPEVEIGEWSMPNE